MKFIWKILTIRYKLLYSTIRYKLIYNKFLYQFIIRRSFMENINNLDTNVEISWQEINQAECEEASFNNIGCWKEFD